MKQKDQFQMEVAAVGKAVRTAIRLKHSMAADEEINALLPTIEADMIAAATKGEPYKLDLGALFASA